MKKHWELWAFAAILTLTATTLSYGVGPLFENERTPGNRLEGPNPDFRLPGQNLPPPAPKIEQVRGEVLKIDGDFFVVRDVAGNEVRLELSQGTKLDAVPQIGDKIEAEVISGGRALSIKSAKPSPP